MNLKQREEILLEIEVHISIIIEKAEQIGLLLNQGELQEAYTLLADLLEATQLIFKVFENFDGYLGGPSPDLIALTENLIEILGAIESAKNNNDLITLKEAISIYLVENLQEWKDKGLETYFQRLSGQPNETSFKSEK
jgi:hypothetical protein